MTMRAPLLSTLLVLAVACQGGSGDETQTLRQAIVGGQLDTTSTHVFIIDMQFNNAQTGLCTATLISARSLLTAAHCVDPERVGATSVTIRASNKADANTLNTGEYINVVDRRLHPNWQWSGSDMAAPTDVAMLLLASAPSGVTPAAINRAALSGFTGKSIRLVGYGRTSAAASSSSAIRRQITLNVTGQDANYIDFGVAGSQGTCVGDSGGPAFHTFSDNVTRQVGVLSGGNSQCGEASDVRVDIHAGFIDQWLSDKEPPICGADGRCQTGCMPVDMDCNCAADGQCTVACPDVLSDPDCPRDCVSNGICATQACPRADTDCVANFGGCTTHEQCAERHCVSDPQNPARYCTTGCTVPSDCPSNAQCTSGVCLLKQRPTGVLGDDCVVGLTLCETGTVCTGPIGGVTICRPACGAQDACPQGTMCADGQGGARFCYSGGSVMMAADAGTVPEVAGKVGCSQAGVSIGWLALFGLLSLALSRRRLY
jgi:hypothetical protein